MECSFRNDFGCFEGTFCLPNYAVHFEVGSSDARSVGRWDKLNVLAEISEEYDRVVFVFFERFLLAFFYGRDFVILLQPQAEQKSKTCAKLKLFFEKT